MADQPKVGFDSARSPRPTHGDAAKLLHLVIVDEVLLGALFDGADQLSARSRQNERVNIRVLEVNDIPDLGGAFVRQVIKGIIRIDLLVHGSPGPHGDGVRAGERIGLDRLLLLADVGGVGR